MTRSEFFEVVEKAVYLSDRALMEALAYIANLQKEYKWIEACRHADNYIVSARTGQTWIQEFSQMKYAQLIEEINNAGIYTDIRSDICQLDAQEADEFMKKFTNEPRRKYITEARDSGRNGFNLNRLLVEFNLCTNINDANDLIRTGLVELNNERIKDIQFHIETGTHFVRIRGELVAEATIL